MALASPAFVVVEGGRLCYGWCMQEPGQQEPEGQDFVVRDEAPADAEMPRDDLDGLRIQRIAAVRRGLYRSRSYCLVGMWGCFGAAAQCAWLMLRQIHRGALDWWTAGWLACIIVLAWTGLRLLGNSRRLLAMARQSTLTDSPATPPDFSKLSDGSHIWKGL